MKKRLYIGARKRIFLVLSNQGQKEYEGPSRQIAVEIALKLNVEWQNTNTTFYVIQQTPYRLLCDLQDAEVLQAFPYQIVSADQAAWYMTAEEYEQQLACADQLWLIKWAGGTLKADFDSFWYENFNTEFRKFL